MTIYTHWQPSFHDVIRLLVLAQCFTIWSAFPISSQIQQRGRYMDPWMRGDWKSYATLSLTETTSLSRPAYTSRWRGLFLRNEFQTETTGFDDADSGTKNTMWFPGARPKANSTLPYTAQLYTIVMVGR